MKNSKLYTDFKFKQIYKFNNNDYHYECIYKQEIKRKIPKNITIRW